MYPHSTIPRVNLLHAHGSPTLHLYLRRGCRCACCKAANASHMREVRAKQTLLQKQRELDYNSNYRKTHPKKFLAYLRTTRQRHPEKYKARCQISNAIHNGRLTRLPCEVCGVVPTHAHHDNYNEPLNVRWLCPTHHLQHHKEEQPCHME